MSLDLNISEPDEFNSVDVHSFIEEFARLRGIKDFTYHAEYICKGDNFVANLFRVLIKDVSGSEGDSISVVVKSLVNTVRQELFHELHEREVIVYTEVFDKFNELQQLLPKENRIHLVECYLSNSTKGKEVLILEDLGLQGFELEPRLKRFEPTHYDHVLLAIMDLAKFHSLSFALQHLNNEAHEELNLKLQDLIFDDKFLEKSRLKHYFQDSFTKSVDEVKNDSAKLKLKNIEMELLQVFRKFVKPGKHNVFCHGDFWINNILYKHDNEGYPTKACFIDFQAVRYANPTTDIIFLIYLCTDALFRSKHFTELQEIYYENLTKSLSLYGLNNNVVYPKEDFDNDIEYYLPFGLLTALVELRLVTKTSEADAILNGSKLIGNENIEEVPGENILFIHRINEVVDEFVSNGILDKIL